MTPWYLQLFILAGSEVNSSKLNALVGKCPVISVRMNDVTVNCLVDTGSMVSTITESFYKKHLCNMIPLQNDVLFKLKTTNGLDIPYMGYIELEVECMGQILENRGILVVKDTCDTATRQHKENVPGLLGMNIISLCKKLLVTDYGKYYVEKVSEIACSNKLKEMFQACDKDENSDVIGFAKLCATSPVRIPANSVTVVNATGPKLPSSYDAIIEPLKHNGHLSSNFIVVNTFVTVKNGFMSVRIANVGNDDIWITPRTRIALITKGQCEVNESSPVKFHRFQNIEEICIQEVCAVENKPNVNSDFILPVDVDKLDYTDNQKDQIKDLFYRYSDVFSKSDTDVGYTTTIKHRIRTVDDIPINQQYRRIPPTQYNEVKEHIQKLLENKIIKESTSPYASPIVLVRKKDNSLRLCVDNRRLNAKTHKDAYPLPRINESFDALSGATIFSTMDLTSGYNQVAVEECDKEKTAFVTPMGLYEYNRMPFGLCNAPATFQRLMQHCFREEIFQTLLVFLDDVIVYSSTLEQHLERIETVFKRLRTHGLKLKPSKCHFL